MISLLADAITVLFLLVVLSYYVLILLPRRRGKRERRFSSLTVIIPAHNEEHIIARSVAAAKKARFRGTKEIIVVDDGSEDGTLRVLRRISGITVLTQKHTGKSASIMRAMKRARGELIAIIDGDSIVAPDAFTHLIGEIEQEGVGAASCVVKVANRRGIGIWLHLEQLYNSLLRGIMAKANANIVTPGPLSLYRREALDAVGGFSTRGFSEDIDVTIRLIRAGWRVGFSTKATTATYMPLDPHGFWRQRTRFARGQIDIFKRHLRLNTTLIDLYTLPLMLFTYIQGVIMGIFTISQIVSGYLTYFSGFSLDALRFLLEWLSAVGFLRWIWSLANGTTPWTAIAVVGVVSTLLTYPLYAYAIVGIDRRIDWRQALAFVFMPLFWLLIMVVYILCLPEVLRRDQRNIWTKRSPEGGGWWR